MWGEKVEYLDLSSEVINGSVVCEDRFGDAFDCMEGTCVLVSA